MHAFSGFTVMTHHTMKYYAIVPIHSTAIIHTVMLAILTLLLLLVIATYTFPVDGIVCIEYGIINDVAILVQLMV